MSGVKETDRGLTVLVQGNPGRCLEGDICSDDGKVLKHIVKQSAEAASDRT